MTADILKKGFKDGYTGEAYILLMFCRLYNSTKK